MQQLGVELESLSSAGGRASPRGRLKYVRKRKPAMSWYVMVIPAIVAALAVVGQYTPAGVASPTSARRGLQQTNSTGAMRPTDGMTKEQKRSGGIILHVGGILYMFCGIAIICDDWFVPALEVITEKLQLSEDVAGATFMAAGGSAPEFFTSLLGVFFFQSDVGFGTIVGSASFNVLFVIGLCAFFSGFEVLPLTWYPLARDSSFYLLSLGVLTGLLQDSQIEWWDSLILSFLYVLYVTLMKFDPQIKAWAYSKAPARVEPTSTADEKPVKPVEEGGEGAEEKKEEEEEEEGGMPTWPSDGSPKDKVAFLLLLPLNGLFWATVPDCRVDEKKKYFVLTFFISIMHIAFLTYWMVWFAEEIGDLIGISVPIMGVTVLAVGTSVPDAISSLVVARKGEGDMALSSSIGSNVFDVCFGLPFPWLLSTAIIYPGSAVIVKANNLLLQVITLMIMVVVVVLSIKLFGWKISKPLGAFYFLMYFIFVGEAILLELDVL